MKSITLRDKLNIAIRVRIDDLSFEQAYSIIFAERDRIKKIEESISAETSYIEKYKDDEKEVDRGIKHINICKEELSNYAEILQRLEKDTTVKVDCYSDQASKVNFNTVLKKYKKI